jgi:hypothetical protein
MQTSEATDKLLPALLSARLDIKPAAKGGENKFHRYSYAKEEDWHASVMPSLLANDLLLAFSVTDTINLDNRLTKKKDTEYAVEVHGVARLMHTSGQWLEVAGVGQGQEGSDKAAYQAMTGMKKYLYALLFALPTTDDPEQDERSQGNHPSPGESGYQRPTNQPVQQTPEPRDMTEGEKVAWMWDAIASAASSKEKLEKLGATIPTKGFSPENQQHLLTRCAEHLTALQP